MITAGTIVRYRASFLRSIGCYTGKLPWAVGEVLNVNEYGVAHVRWSTDEAPPHVHTKALIEASRVWTEAV